MPNKENKNKEVIDYSKFFEKPASVKALAGEGEKIPEKRGRFIFDSFRDFWSQADKKTRIEIIIFLVVLVTMVSVLAFYFFKPKPKGLELPPVLPPPGEEEMLGR